MDRTLLSANHVTMCHQCVVRPSEDRCLFRSNHVLRCVHLVSAHRLGAGRDVVGWQRRSSRVRVRLFEFKIVVFILIEFLVNLLKCYF
jgi:hypothetical protein